MKNLVLFAALLIAGCAASSISKYRFPGDDHVYSFEVKKEGALAINAILYIDGEPIDTIKGLHGIDKPNDQRSFIWKERNVVFSANVNPVTGSTGYRVLINNEIVSEK